MPDVASSHEEEDGLSVDSPDSNTEPLKAVRKRPDHIDSRIFPHMAPRGIYVAIPMLATLRSKSV
jgi:hypothetical protein